MECLRGYVGVLGCGTGTFLSGKYINSLPGISLESIEALANDESKTFIEVFEEIEERAIAKFPIELNERFAKRYKLKQIRSSLNLLKRVDEGTILPAAAVKRGFSAELSLKNNYFIASNLQSHYIESLSIFVVDKTEINPNPIVINVVDLDTEDVIDTFTIANGDYDDGWNEVFVNRSYPVNRIACVYDATLIKSPLQVINPLISTGYASMATLIYGTYCEPYLRGIQYTTPDLPAFGTNIFGLTGILGVKCRYDNIVCGNRDAFLYPWWYFLGAETMIENINSHRLNPFTGLDSEKASKLYSDFMAEFSRSLDQVVDSINLDTADTCLECNESIRYVESKM